MHFTCRSFIGHSSPDSWCQFWENEPDDPNLVLTRGHLFGLLSFSSADSDISALGHQLIAFIDENYFQSNDFTADVWLKNVLNDFLSHSEFDLSELSLIIAISVGNDIHLATINSGNCALSRGSKISLLLQGRPSEVSLISGRSAPEDRLFICTDNFFNQFTWTKIKSFVALENISEIEENFLGLLYSFDSQQSLAGALIQIHPDEPEIITPPPTLPESTLTTPEPPIYPKPSSVFVSHSESSSLTRRHRLNVAVSVIILLALVASSYYGYRQNKSRLAEKHYQELKNTLSGKINNAFAVKNLNLDTALTLAKESESLLTQMKSQPGHLDEITQFQNQIQSLLSQTGSADSFVPETFFDTTLINSAAKYQTITLSGSSLYLLDSTNGRLDSLDITKKSHQNISTTDDLKNTSGMGADGTSVYLLKNSEIFLAQKTSLVSKINFSAQIPNFSSGTFAFWNGSLYLLSSSNIWKFTPTSNTFSSAASWLKDNETLPSNSTSLAINGQVWVLSQNGTIVPYSHGTRQDFKSSPQSLKSANHLVTSLDSEILAFTETDNQVYVYKKTGQSLGRYNFGTKKIFSLAYDPAKNQLLALCSDQKIYKISL